MRIMVRYEFRSNCCGARIKRKGDYSICKKCKKRCVLERVKPVNNSTCKIKDLDIK